LTLFLWRDKKYYNSAAEISKLINLETHSMKTPKYTMVMAAVASAILGGAVSAEAQTVTFSSSTLTDTYMSWSPSAYTVANYPTDGGASASGWSIPALPGSFSGNTLTLSPNVNTYAAGNTYWTNPDGSGANIMDGAIYTLASSAPYGGYSADAFIKDFGPGYSYNGEQTVNLTPGVDSVTYALTGNNPGEIVQFGFEVIGPDANPATVASLGSVEIAPTPEPSTMAMAGIGLLGFLGSRLRRRI
jgi:PEP-CTERM motif